MTITIALHYGVLGDTMGSVGFLFPTQSRIQNGCVAPVQTSVRAFLTRSACIY